MSASVRPLSDMAQPGMVPGAGATPATFERAKRRSRTFEGDWEAFLNKTTNVLEQQERFYDWLKYREGVRNQRYYEGQFFFHFSDQTGLVRDLPHTDDDPFYPHNWFQYFVDLSVSAALEASPDIVIDPSDDDEHNIMAARGAQRLADYAEMELLTEEFKLEAEKTRQLYCGAWWYSYWSLDAGKLFASRPVFDEKTVQMTDDAFICGCENMGPVERLIQTATGPTCPKCGRSDQLQILHGPKTTIHEIKEYKKVPIGFPVVECVSPLQMKGDRRAPHYMRGGYICRTRLLDRDNVADRITWWDEKGMAGRGSGSDDYGIRAEELARRPSTIDSTNRVPVGSADREGSDVVVKQWWLQPWKYENVEFASDVEFIGQEVTRVPARTRLGEVFPKGLYLLKVADQWLDHGEEDFRKHWVYIPYVYLPHKVDGGTTVTSMVEPQREMIEINSLLFLYLKARSGGAPTIIKSPLSETDFDGSPATITRLPQGSPDIKELFFQPQFPPPDPNLTGYANRMSGEMQIMAQVVSPTTTGDPAAQEMGGTDTARGMMIMNAKAQGLQGPKLMPLAFGQAQAVTQWIELFRQNVVDDVPIPLKGKTGEPEWFEINGSDLEADFAIYPKPKSWLPHPREEQQAAMQNAFTTFGNILLNPQAPASLKDKILEVYGIEGVDLDDYNQETRDAILRIDAMEKLIPDAIKLAQWYSSQMASQPPQAQPSGPPGMPPGAPPPPQVAPAGPPPGAPPEAAPSGPPGAPAAPGQSGGEAPPTDPSELAGTLLAKMVPIDEDLDDPQPYLDYFKTWLKGDEGKDANPVLRSAVRTQWKQYNQMQQAAMQQQMQQQMQMQAQVAAMQEQAKMPIEQTRQQGKLADTSLKGQIEMAKLQATPPEPGPAPTPPPPDNVVRDKVVQAALQAAQEDQKHAHRMDELGITHGHRLREAVAKGAMSAAQSAMKPQPLSQAGVGGSLVEGASQVPGLPGYEGTSPLPSQPAI